MPSRHKETDPSPAAPARRLPHGTFPAVSTHVCRPRACIPPRSSATASACSSGSPAGACHAAGCRAEDLLVTQHQLCQLLAGDPAPRHINGTGETGLCAAAAAHAACRIPHRTLRPHRPCTGRAAVHAGSAPDAALRAKDQLRLRILCLRVVAPGTAEIAALQKTLVVRMPGPSWNDMRWIFVMSSSCMAPPPFLPPAAAGFHIEVAKKVCYNTITIDNSSEN